MATTARHRRPSPARWLVVLVSATLGAALGIGGVILASPNALFGQPTPQHAAPPGTTSPSTTPPRPAEVVRPVDPAAFAAPATDAAGLAVTVLRPEKVKGGVRLTIALANTSNAPMTLDTGALGPHNPSFNGAPVPVIMTPVRKKLVPGEGYTYQCVVKLPTMNLGQLAFVVGPVSAAGQAAGD